VILVQLAAPHALTYSLARLVNLAISSLQQLLNAKKFQVIVTQAALYVFRQTDQFAESVWTQPNASAIWANVLTVLLQVTPQTQKHLFMKSKV
jgi:hypothetical protein